MPRARWISRSSATRLAASICALASGSLSRWPVWAIRSGCMRRKSTDDTVPTPPKLATVPASEPADTPTPIPPCTTGMSSRPARRQVRRPSLRARVCSSAASWATVGVAWWEVCSLSKSCSMLLHFLCCGPCRRGEANQPGPPALCGASNTGALRTRGFIAPAVSRRLRARCLPPGPGPPAAACIGAAPCCATAAPAGP